MQRVGLPETPRNTAARVTINQPRRSSFYKVLANHKDTNSGEFIVA